MNPEFGHEAHFKLINHIGRGFPLNCPNDIDLSSDNDEIQGVIEHILDQAEAPLQDICRLQGQMAECVERLHSLHELKPSDGRSWC